MAIGIVLLLLVGCSNSDDPGGQKPESPTGTDANSQAEAPKAQPEVGDKTKYPTLFQVIDPDNGRMFVLDPTSDTLSRLNLDDSVEIVGPDGTVLEDGLRNPLLRKGVPLILTRVEKDGETRTRLQVGTE